MINSCDGSTLKFFWDEKNVYEEETCWNEVFDGLSGRGWEYPNIWPWSIDDQMIMDGVENLQKTRHELHDNGRWDKGTFNMIFLTDVRACHTTTKPLLDITYRGKTILSSL